MQLRFCSGCAIKISKEYHQKLTEFAKNTKTNAQIIKEYYLKN
jgi:hypothetical protein